MKVIQQLILLITFLCGYIISANAQSAIKIDSAYIYKWIYSDCTRYYDDYHYAGNFKSVTIMGYKATDSAMKDKKLSTKFYYRFNEDGHALLEDKYYYDTKLRDSNI